MGSGMSKPTVVDSSGVKVLGTADEMEKVFKQIKALSVNIPEEIKKWKLGQKIEIKNTEPTPEQAIKDAYNVAMSIVKKSKTPGYIKFDEIKNSVLNKVNKKKTLNGEGGPYDGQGGLWSNIGNAVSDAMSYKASYNREDYLKEQAQKSITTPTIAPPVEPIKKPGFIESIFKPKTKLAVSPTYNVRGVNVSDNDINEATNILYGEISNRNPQKQTEEVKHAINTAINRANNNPKRYNGSLLNVLKEPAQYQSYAPNGMRKNGKIVESQYQKLKRGIIDEGGKQKLETIKLALSEMKSGNFIDTTGGKTFYVHAKDGSIWLGATQKEAKALANAHEKAIKTKPTNWKTVAGFPQVASR
jgi:hypothetical protein